MYMNIEQKTSTSDQVNLSFSDSAIEKIRMMMIKEGKEGCGLRFGVLTGGCAGLSYDMKFAKRPYDNDIILNINGLDVYVNPESVPFINGIEVDFLETLRESGFKYKNPNASSSCGCGYSFS